MNISTFFIFAFSFILIQGETTSVSLNTDYLINRIRNVTSSATSFLSDSIKKQTEIITQVKNTATDYVSNAVEKPKAILINAKEATKDYIDSTASKGMEIKVRALAEILRTEMPYGIPALDLPVLEPLKIKHIEFSTNDKDIGNITGAADNVTIHHLSTFIIDHVQVHQHDGLSLALNISVPTIQADGMYKILGMLGKGFVFDGNGPFNLEIREGRFYIDVVLGYSGGLYVKNLNIDFYIRSLVAVFQDLFKNPEVNDTMNKVISDVGPQVLEFLKPKVRPSIEEFLARQINTTISDLTVRNMIGILTGTLHLSDIAHLLRPQPSH